MRRLSQEQLEKRYKECIESAGNYNLFDFVVGAKEMSCQPMATFEEYVNEMNKECKKSFLHWLWNNEEDIHHDFYRMFSTIIRAL